MPIRFLDVLGMGIDNFGRTLKTLAETIWADLRLRPANPSYWKHFFWTSSPSHVTDMYKMGVPPIKFFFFLKKKKERERNHSMFLVQA